MSYKEKITRNALRLLAELQATRKESYDAGYDFGLYGATEENYALRFFHVKENTAAWEEGKADAEAGRPNKYLITT